MVEVPLFSGFEPPPVEEPEPGLSADRRRTLRQAEDIARGIHPLTRDTVHLLSDINPQPTDAKNLPYRCGSCRWRVVASYHNRSYPKCAFPGTYSAEDYERFDPPRVSHSAASDVRAWWPACRDYTPGDNQLSPDAARHIPEDARP